MPRNGKKRAKYPLVSRLNIDGPGIWATCDKGREKTAIGELYDLFESLADELWLPEAETAKDSLSPISASDIDSQFAKEIQDLKKPRLQKRFGTVRVASRPYISLIVGSASIQTGTPCVVFISCKPPVDPVRLLEHHFESIEKTGVTRTKHVLRLNPVSHTCVASTPEILVLFRKFIPPAFNALPVKPDGSKSYRFKLDMTLRNHDKIKKSELLPLLAACVPAEGGHKVDLEHPEVVIIVNILKSVCGISIVQHYERFKRFNVIQVGEAARRKADMEKL